MSISNLRWRAASALIAAGAAAAAALGLALPAGAVTGTAEISPEMAGYTATGAQFRTVRALVYLRNPAQYASEASQYSHSVQLWSADRVAVLSLRASTSGGGYTPQATVYDASTHQVVVSDPKASWCHQLQQQAQCVPYGGQTLSVGESGYLVLFYDPAEGHLTGYVYDPASSYYFFTQYALGTGQSFGQARIGTEFGADPWTAPSYTPPANLTKIAAYSAAYLTTYNDHTATLWSWWVHHKLLANTGQQSAADWVAIPTNLTNGGANFQTFFVPQSGQSPNQPVLH